MTEPARGPGSPGGGRRIPQPKPSVPVLAYAGLGGLALAVYLAAGVFGWSFGEEDTTVMPASVRQTPGGYRAFHFWHTGYQGGK